jgi:O-antigen/teichoic acid export membrane protein
MRPSIVTVIDQALVSGGNFLTIAICARILPVTEQGKLGYVIAAYMATIILNLTGIFQWANVQAPKEGNPNLYRDNLCKLQAFLSVPSSFLLALLIVLIGKLSGWSLSGEEFLLSFVFLIIQQLADFARRSAYIFSNAKHALLNSVKIYPPRLLLLGFLRPTHIAEVLVLLAAASTLPAIITLFHATKGKTSLRHFSRFIKGHYYNSKWLIASGPLMWLWSYIPTFSLGNILGMASVGAFITVRSVANIANVAMELLETEVSAKAGKLYAENKDALAKSLRKVRVAGLSLWGVAFVLLSLYGERLLGIVFGDQYSQYSDVMVILWVAQGVTFLFRLNAVRIRTYGINIAIPAGYMFGTVMVLLTVYPLISNINILGAAMSYVAGASFIFLGQVFAFNRMRRQEI